MRIASGTIASLALTVGALLLLAAVDSSEDVMNSGRRPPKTSFLRSDSSRKLYNYSRNNNNNQNYNGYNGAYGGSYGGNNGGNNNDDGNNNGNNNGDDNYGGDYGNNGDDQNYYNYAMDNYGGDDASYYNSNKNYQADGSSYNGRDQQWGGQSVQTYNDDEEPEVTEVYTEQDGWEIQGKFGGLSGTETLAVAALAITVSLALLCCFLLFNGFNLIDVIQLYCCCGLFSHKDQGSEILEDGFVKLGDY